MPDLSQHESNEIVKLLSLGDSSAGKTGSLASLVDAGLKLRILDFDNGLSVLGGYVKDKALLKNVSYVTLRDDYNFLAGRVSIKSATAFQRGMNALDNGKEFGEGVGGIRSWGPDTVFVLDTLALASKASLYQVMVINGRGAQSPHQSDYGTAMESIERLLEMVTSDSVKCHVIVNTHTFTSEGSMKVYPEAIGSKLPPKVGKMFDNMISLSITGGARTFKTSKDGLLALKTAKRIKDTYPIETGLRDIFLDLTGKKALV